MPTAASANPVRPRRTRSVVVKCGVAIERAMTSSIVDTPLKGSSASTAATARRTAAAGAHVADDAHDLHPLRRAARALRDPAAHRVLIAEKPVRQTLVDHHY